MGRVSRRIIYPYRQTTTIGELIPMSEYPFAPVHWQMGQALLPEHLIAQETALSANTYLRHQSGGLPCYGVGKLEWDKDLLMTGSLNIKALRLFTRTNSLLVDFPGNAYLSNHALQFNTLPRVEIFYVVLQAHSETQNTTDNCAQQSVAQRPYQIILTMQPVPAEDDETIYRGCAEICRGKLAEFVLDNNGRWKLSERYIPPLVQLGMSEFLIGPLQQLNVLLGRYIKETLALYQKQQLPDSRCYEIKNCINVIYENRQFIANHINLGRQHGELQMHPYYLYEQLQRLHRQLALLNGEWSPLPLDIYQHNDLHGTFKLLFQNVVTRLKLPSSQSQSLQLHLKDGCYQTVLPTNLNKQDKYYLIINCEQQPPLENKALPCISSRKRVATLFHYSLSGVPLKAVKHQTLSHYFGQNTQCFALGHGEELQHIVRDASMAFLAQPEFANYTFYLFYQPQQQSNTGGGNGAAR
jgi:type VI secretion system protein ImpJ